MVEKRTLKREGSVHVMCARLPEAMDHRYFRPEGSGLLHSHLHSPL